MISALNLTHFRSRLIDLFVGILFSKKNRSEALEPLLSKHPDVDRVISQ